MAKDDLITNTVELQKFGNSLKKLSDDLKLSLDQTLKNLDKLGESFKDKQYQTFKPLLEEKTKVLRERSVDMMEYGKHLTVLAKKAQAFLDAPMVRK